MSPGSRRVSGDIPGLKSLEHEEICGDFRVSGGVWLPFRPRESCGNAQSFLKTHWFCMVSWCPPGPRERQLPGVIEASSSFHSLTLMLSLTEFTLFTIPGL